MDVMESVFKMGSSLALVLAIVVVAAAAARRWLMPLGGTVPPYSLRIGGSVSLGGRRSVVVLEIGGRALVVGATPQNLVLLAQFDQEIDVAGPALLNAPKPQVSPSRSRLLSSVGFIKSHLLREAAPPCFASDQKREEAE